ncbi:uncharacterized protein M6B38_205535 [Iris pallida]|uniref:Uncharacterized protein n=1 Tax=Iris pallida TaxID=29817 RepID=A0AAX6E7I0_IRIPA|nr:uncharacterized protein M6B38_205535 [Iris pallida]
MCDGGGSGGSESGKAADGKADEFGLPAVEVRYRDPILEVVLVTRGAAPPGRKKLLFYESSASSPKKAPRS